MGGADGAGSGVAAFDVFVSDDGGPFATLVTATAATSATFTGRAGHTYRFYSVATDRVGLVQATPAAQATTTVALPAGVVTLTPAALPAGRAGAAYAQTLTATDTRVSSAFTFSVTSGAIPPGLAIQPPSAGADGATFLTGTPIQAGTYSFTITAEDDASNRGSRSYTLVVNPPEGPPPAPSPVLVGYPRFAVGSDAGGPSAVTVHNQYGMKGAALDPFSGRSPGGVRTAVGDFNGDGVPDVAVGIGPGVTAEVKVLDGLTGAMLFSTNPFADFAGGVFVAAGDVDGDGKADLVVTPDEGGGPRVSLFRGGDFTRVAAFFGIDDPAFRGGARAALGDLDGDRFADLVGGGGPGGGPRVLVVSGRALLAAGGDAALAAPLANFFAGDTVKRGGVRVAVKDLDGDARADLVVGDGAGAGSRVTGYRGQDFGGGGAPAAFEFDAFPGLTAGVFLG